MKNVLICRAYYTCAFPTRAALPMKKYLLSWPSYWPAWLLLLVLLPTIGRAQAIVNENFNSPWTTPTTLITVGTTGTWGDDGATGDQQWHRNDYPIGWTPSIYSNVRLNDADGVAGSYAAFHSTGAASGSTGSLVSPVLSFAGYPDHKLLSFYLGNTSGADVVTVYLSTDGGLTYGSALAMYPARPNAFDRAFRRVVLDLGTTTSSTVRIKFTATADAGMSDIGLDNFQVVNRPLAPFSGTYTIDQTLPNAGTNFTSFTEAFSLLNLAGVGGPTTFRVANGQTFTEQTPPLTVSGAVAAPILFREATLTAALTDNPTISSALAETGALVLLSGADYVTFDGINVQYVGTSLAQRFGYVVSNASATNGATYNTIRNAAITLSRDSDRSTGLVQATGTTYGGAGATASTGTNRYNSYHNLKFSNMQNGVNLSGTSTTYPDYSTLLYNCAVGDPSVSADIGGSKSGATTGISAFGQSKLSLHDNVLRNIVVTTANTGARGMSLTSLCGTGPDACNVYNNQVITVGSARENLQRVYGIIAGTASSGVHTLNLYNNFVSEVLNQYSSRSATRSPYIIGIYINNSGTPDQTINVSFNSVRIDTTPLAFLAASTCYEVTSATGAVVNTRNNVFANVSQGKITNATTQPQHYTWLAPDAGVVGGGASVSNYNDLYIANPLNSMGGTAGFVGAVSSTGQTIASYATLADWQAATSQDANSVSVDPLFASATDLHLQPASPLVSLGTPVAGISTDIDNLPRKVTTPDIGADEFGGAPIPIATNWTGALNTDWFNAGNWTAGVPTATLDAQIPVVSSNNYPVVTSGTAVAKNLALSTGATLTQSGGTLSLTGNLSNDGNFRSLGGVLATTGSTQQVLGGSSLLTLRNLRIGAAGATLGTYTSLGEVLTLLGDLATAGQTLVLKSSVSGGVATDALVVNSGGVVVGTATVERAIDPSLNPGLGYRHLSPPVSPATVSNLSVFTTGVFPPVVNPAYNTAAVPDQVIPFPTVFGYDDSRLSLANSLRSFDKGFFSPASLSDPLVVGRGYTVNIPAYVVVAFKGTLTNGDQVLNLTSTRPTYPDGGWQLLGNPYPAPLNYALVDPTDRAGLEGAIYVYQSTSQYAGRYRSYVNGIGNPVLPVGQGFFARVAAGLSTATMTFRNSQRLTAPNSTTFQRTTADPRPLVQLTLQNAAGALADEATVYFENGATAGFEPAFDAEKLANPSGLNLSTMQAGQKLSIDGQPELGASQRVVPLALGVPVAGVYTFRASQLLNLSAVPVYLRDLQTGALIDLAAQPSYQFTVANAAALNTTRFALVFSPQKPLATAPAALAQQVALYPNPAKIQATIELPASLSRQPVTAALVDALGHVVRQQALPAGVATHTLPLTNVAPGVYSLRLNTQQGTITKKLVVD